MQNKKHFVTLQLGPVNMSKNERAMVLGLITTMLNGLLENVKHPREAASFIEYFFRERLEKVDVNLMQQLEVVQRNKMTTILEAKDQGTSPSLILDVLQQKRGFNHVS